MGGGGAGRGRGVTCLFAGPSGVGKTLSAEVLAHELGVDLYTIDLSQVVDKYIGETEKNLERIFTEAEGVNGVLFFDEADALFGKRSDVQSAHDRHANVEVAYLLQRMERFDGVAVLATNLRGNLDEAFTRRIDVIVQFTEPDVDERLRLWQLHLPPTLPVADDLDLPLLAKALDITGGVIRNVTLAAAYMAAAEQRPLSMADLVTATRREYRKVGRLVPSGVFDDAPDEGDEA
jgi:SpoVK/Ycf46/Vps4 family AAA+-type ATPase